MVRKLSRAQRRESYLQCAVEIWEKIEQWYDDHPEATFGEIEERAMNPCVIPREQAVLGARPGVSR